MCGFRSVQELVTRECAVGTSRMCTHLDPDLSPHQQCRNIYYSPSTVLKHRSLTAAAAVTHSDLPASWLALDLVAGGGSARPGLSDKLSWYWGAGHEATVSAGLVAWARSGALSSPFRLVQKHAHATRGDPTGQWWRPAFPLRSRLPSVLFPGSCEMCRFLAPSVLKC